MNEICAGCGVDTREIHEYYMVLHTLWSAHGAGRRMLCIGCLEDRLGRALTPEDFTGAPINTDPEDALWQRSDRLRNRLAA